MQTTNALNEFRTQEAQTFKRIEQLDQIRQLDPVAFERFVGSLFERMGYQVQTTALSGDEGVDLVLRKDQKLAIVQCKRYEGPVGQPIVRDLYGAMVHNRADEAYLVTTGTGLWQFFAHERTLSEAGCACFIVSCWRRA